MQLLFAVEATAALSRAPGRERLASFSAPFSSHFFFSQFDVGKGEGGSAGGRREARGGAAREKRDPVAFVQPWHEAWDLP